MARKSSPETPAKPLPFDPAPGARLAGKALRGAGVQGALMGRVAVWQYVTDPAQRGPASEVDVAIAQADAAALTAWLQRKDFAVDALPTGGLRARTEQGVAVHFIHHAGGRDNLQALYADAVVQAQAQERLAQVGDETLLLTPPAHLLTMELATGGKEHERDVRRLLKVAGLDVAQVQSLVQAHLGTLGISRLDLVLREAGRAPGSRR